MQVFGRANLPDGLYEVTTAYLCAGFVVKAEMVIQCAPILVPKLLYWLTVARRVECPVSE